MSQAVDFDDDGFIADFFSLLTLRRGCGSICYNITLVLFKTTFWVSFFIMTTLLPRTCVAPGSTSILDFYCDANGNELPLLSFKVERIARTIQLLTNSTVDLTVHVVLFVSAHRHPGFAISLNVVR